MTDKTTSRSNGKLTVRAGKLTRYGMRIINECIEYEGYNDNPVGVAFMTDIDIGIVIEFMDR